MCFFSAQLLRRNPERRLGAGDKDAEEVKKHLFFRVRNKNNICTMHFVIKEKNELTGPPVFPGRTWIGTDFWLRR